MHAHTRQWKKANKSISDTKKSKHSEWTQWDEAKRKGRTTLRTPCHKFLATPLDTDDGRTDRRTDNTWWQYRAMHRVVKITAKSARGVPFAEQRADASVSRHSAEWRNHRPVQLPIYLLTLERRCVVSRINANGRIDYGPPDSIWVRPGT